MKGLAPPVRTNLLSLNRITHVAHSAHVYTSHECVYTFLTILTCRPRYLCQFIHHFAQLKETRRTTSASEDLSALEFLDTISLFN